MNRLMSLTAAFTLASLVACAEPTEAENIVVEGTASSILVTWDGPAENIAMSQGQDWFWNLSLENPPEDCVNGLDGGAGLNFPEVPEGYVNLTQNSEPQEAPTTLEDGEYALGVAVCVEQEDSADLLTRSFINNGVSFSIVDGLVVMDEE